MSPKLYTLADPDVYAPLAALAQHEPRLLPADVRSGWQATDHDLWTAWAPAGETYGAGTLRVTAAAANGREQSVLDVFAGACFERRVPFRHVSTRIVHSLLNGEHGSRPQAGRFCVASPADPRAADDLLARLHAALGLETGPRPLSGQRHLDSGVLWLDHVAPPDRRVPGADGVWATTSEDELLDGPAPMPPAPPGYTPTRLLGFSNAGHSFLARNPRDGGTVHVKHCFAHAGLDPDGRSATDRLRELRHRLDRVHATAPGLCPRPLDHPADSHNAWLICEAVPGVPLIRWIPQHSPVTDLSATAHDWSAYYMQASALLDNLEKALRRIVEAGVTPSRLDLHDVLIDEHDAVRITGFAVPGPRAGRRARVSELLAEAALPLLTPCAAAAARDGGVLAHVQRDLARRGGAVPPALWQVASRAAGPTAGAPLPTPDEVERDERAALCGLRDRLAAGIVHAAEDLPWQLFPTVPQAHLTNALGVAYGAAGIVHALRISGSAVPDRVPARLCRDALAQRRELPPGLYSGLAGIAWVLADLGLLDEASALLAAADEHPLTRSSMTLAWGGAGVALAHLALYGHGGDQRHLDRAVELTRLPGTPADLTALLGPADMTGLWYGRAGIAHALQQLGGVLGDDAPLRQGRALLHAELDRAVDRRGELTFRASERDRRELYYLYCGTAGFLTAVARQLAAAPDERLADALPKLVRKASMTQVSHVGLGNGLAGLGFALSECAAILGDEAARAAAWHSAGALFQHAAGHGEDARVLGDLLLRSSFELWSGGAGVLVFLTHLLDRRPDALFTVDALAAPPRLPLVNRSGGTTKRREYNHVGRAIAAEHGDRHHGGA